MRDAFNGMDDEVIDQGNSRNTGQSGRNNVQVVGAAAMNAAYVTISIHSRDNGSDFGDTREGMGVKS